MNLLLANVDGRNDSPMQGRLPFEAFLADLSAAFVNVPADQLDSQITAGLRQIVEFLGIDRSGFGQLTPGENKIAITHSYQAPGAPPMPRVILEAKFPTYARKIREGEPFWLPDDIDPSEATAAEWEHLARSGLKSQLIIPLKVAGAVVGKIGFASFRSRLEWPDDLVLRLRLIGDAFTHALARKYADEALQRANQQVSFLRSRLANARQSLLKVLRQTTQRQSHELSQEEEVHGVKRLLDSLKPREREVFLHVAAGMPNKNIAARLGLCLQTVKLHRGRMMRKLRLDSVAQLVRLAEKARALLPGL